MNFGSRLTSVIVIPILAILSIGIITWEAHVMYVSRHGRNEWVDQRQCQVAVVSKKCYPILVALTLGSWFLGTEAVYQQSLWMFSVTFSLNIALGFSIFFAHTSSDQEVFLN
jgi:uncharacterized membrane protein YjgN (DUF898 family)